MKLRVSNIALTYLVKLCVLALCSHTNAQVTQFKKSVLDSLRPHKLYGTGGLSFSLNQNSNRELYIMADASLMYATHKHTVEYLSSMFYNSTNKVSSSNRFYSMVRAGLFRNVREEQGSMLLKKQRVFGEPFVFFQWDENRGISQRWQFGANAVYALRSNMRHVKWNLGAGILYEVEDWRVFSREKQAAFDTLPSAIKQLLQRYIGINNRGHLMRNNWRMNFYSNLWYESKVFSINLFLGVQQPFKAPFEGLPDIDFYPYPKKRFPRATLETSLNFKITRYFSVVTRYYIQSDKGQLTQFVPNVVYTLSQGVSINL